MPIYEFACQDCGTNFEKRISFSQTAAPACDACESNNVHRRMSVPAIHFKGSGWYITDSKKANSASAPSKAESNGSTDGHEGSKTTASTPEPAAA